MRWRVRLDDIDAGGVVFAARLIALAHQAYEEAMDEAGLALAAVVRDGRWALPLVRVEADFRAPLRHGDDLTLVVGLAGSSERSYRIVVRVFTAPARLAAQVEQVHVALDLASGRAEALPEALRAALARLPPLAEDPAPASGLR